MGSHRGCQCEGHWTTRLINYVVIQREYAVIDGERKPSRYSEIKCRGCYRKWRSDAGYIAKLPDGKERKYKKLTDEDVLVLVRAGRIVADPKTGVIRKQRRKGNHLGGKWDSEWVELKQAPDRNGYLFVDVKYKGARRRCAVHRLVWMQVHDELVPEGFDLDHIDRGKANCRISNLRLRDLHENRSDQKHGGKEEEGIPF